MKRSYLFIKNQMMNLIHFDYQYNLITPIYNCVHISNYLSHSRLSKFATSIGGLALFTYLIRGLKNAIPIILIIIIN